MSNHNHVDPVDEMRFALSQVNNPYHRAMICAWLTALEQLERMEVTLGGIASYLDEMLGADDAIHPDDDDS